MIRKKDKIIEPELSYRLVGILFRVHSELGRFCRERQYADALEQELKKEDILFKREQAAPVADRKSNFADFVIEDKIILELKAKQIVTKEDYDQLQRYLQIAGKELGLLVNFRRKYLEPKRILNTALYSEHSDKFVNSDY